MPDKKLTLARLHLDGSWASAEAEVSNDISAAALAEREGIRVPREALQAEVDDYRAYRGLLEERATLRWLKSAGVDRKALVAYCRARVQRQLLLAALSAAAVREWFDQHRVDYEAALLSVMSFESESEALQLRTATLGAPHAFDDFAWTRLQADPALPASGALGWRLRRDLPAPVAAAVFAKDAGLVAGPVRYAGSFRLYRIWRRREAELTTAIEAECRADCLAARLRDAPRNSP